MTAWMSCDVTVAAPDEELLERSRLLLMTAVIWMIAELVRKGTYSCAAKMHEISKIDLWFIDKIADHGRDGKCFERRGPLTPELLGRSKDEWNSRMTVIG